MVDIRAPMQASIYQIMVNIGEIIKEGQELLILESMKMEIPLESPISGSVSEIYVEAGTAVNEGDLLIRLQP
jgi:acetyl-CoA carboxylase biotin carboxyl carrier protein